VLRTDRGGALFGMPILVTTKTVVSALTMALAWAKPSKPPAWRPYTRQR
jgi:hypothetical protein